MTYEWTLYLCLFLALWSAVIGGVFSAFSEFIMAGLLRSEPSGGIEAMQQINKTVIKTQFVAGILLIAPASVLFALHSLTVFEGAALVALIAAPLVYVPSVFLMTIDLTTPRRTRGPIGPDTAVTGRGSTMCAPLAASLRRRFMSLPQFC